MRQKVRDKVVSRKGQATVEAAVALPVVFVMLLLLIQPAIVLYDRMVMENAAQEACRLLVTGDMRAESLCNDFVKRRLGAVPQIDFFHVHGSKCSWRVKSTGSASSDRVEVTISTEVKPLPIMDFGGVLLGIVNERGNLDVEVSASMATRAAWAQSSLQGVSPGEMVGAWLDDD